jgi:hypothetical protein
MYIVWAVTCQAWQPPSSPTSHPLSTRCFARPPLSPTRASPPSQSPVWWRWGRRPLAASWPQTARPAAACCSWLLQCRLAPARVAAGPRRGEGQSAHRRRRCTQPGTVGGGAAGRLRRAGLHPRPPSLRVVRSSAGARHSLCCSGPGLSSPAWHAAHSEHLGPFMPAMHHAHSQPAGLPVPPPLKLRAPVVYDSGSLARIYQLRGLCKGQEAGKCEEGTANVSPSRRWNPTLSPGSFKTAILLLQSTQRPLVMLSVARGHHGPPAWSRTILSCCRMLHGLPAAESTSIRLAPISNSRSIA